MTRHGSTKHLLGTAALVLAIMVTATAPAGAINSRAGTSAFSFLKINVSARAVGMGGAFTGLADDISSLYYNPAGIVGLEGKQLIAGYHDYFAEMQSGFVGFSKPLNDKTAFGVYASYLNFGDFTRTNENGDVLGDFGGGDLLLAGGLAMRPSYELALGGTIKLIHESVDDYSATGLAIDLGARYSKIRDRLVFGLAVQNLGFQLSSLGNEKDKLPITVRGGASLRPRDVNLTFVGDLVVPIDNNPYVALGGEYSYFRPLLLRLGWNSFGSNYRTEDSEDNWAGLGVGIGFQFSAMEISYAFTPGAELGDSHRITLTGGW